jgi:molybdopterin/thiamine biosynthesis adenylyltransferase
MKGVTMDLRKHSEYFDPNEVSEPIHIIGLGAVGSNIADQLARFGFDNFHLWDMDTVEFKNITNQMYSTFHVNYPKTKAMRAIIKDINPNANITLHEKYTGEPLEGYIFLAVDSISVRKLAVTSNMDNEKVLAIFDTRIGAMDAQAYAAERNSLGDLLSTMDFTDEESLRDAPRSLCGEMISIRSTVQIITSLQVQNFIEFLRGKPLKKQILFMGEIPYLIVSEEVL